MSISKKSAQSLLIEMYFNDQKLSSGTAFIVKSNHRHVLITNRHNVTGLHQKTGKHLSKTCGIPNRIIVWHNLEGIEIGWNALAYDLYDADHNERWVEHPKYGKAADFVGLQIELEEPFIAYPYNLATPLKRMLLLPSDKVSVIGFPFGKSSGGRLAIWATGSLASDMEVDFDDQPTFLIDCRSRPGQSGSPVLAIASGAITYSDGSIEMAAQQKTEFLGIYSGRIHDESDIGIVWKRSAIAELLDFINATQPI